MFKFITSVLAMLIIVSNIDNAFASQQSNNLSVENGGSVVQPQEEITDTKNLAQVGEVTFGCAIAEGIPVTFAQVNSDSGQEKKDILYWVSKHFPDPDQAEQLCQNVAQKLQLAYDSSDLRDMGIYTGRVQGNISNQYVLCLKQTEGTSCNAEDFILVTAQTKCIDPKAVLYDMGSKEIVDTKQRPLCSGTKGDFTTRLRFNWLPF